MRPFVHSSRLCFPLGPPATTTSRLSNLEARCEVGSNRPDIGEQGRATWEADSAVSSAHVNSMPQCSEQLGTDNLARSDRSASLGCSSARHPHHSGDDPKCRCSVHSTAREDGESADSLEHSRQCSEPGRHPDLQMQHQTEGESQPNKTRPTPIRSARSSCGVCAVEFACADFRWVQLGRSRDGDQRCVDPVRFRVRFLPFMRVFMRLLLRPVVLKTASKTKYLLLMTSWT